jgi:hypothetical protein
MEKAQKKQNQNNSRKFTSDLPQIFLYQLKYHDKTKSQPVLYIAKIKLLLLF